MTIWLALTSFFVSFIGFGIRSLHTKNVAGNHYKMAALSALVLLSAEAVNFSFVARYGLIVIIPAGAGAALGVIVSMWLHNYFVRNK